MTTVDAAMSPDKSIEIHEVGKRYSLGEREQYGALRDVIASAVKNVGNRRQQQSEDERYRWALDSVTFDVAPGEVVGLVGRNGAGKSTLLKVISRITRPTRGSVTIRGRIGTLLEVGSGFHPELTGAENIFLNGAILGMRRSEIRASFDEIVEFSGLSTFLDTPVKRYSTGMFMRLAFSVAAHLETEILLVDEVLAVGDADFQRKCISRMRELSHSEGRTVVFVSHDDAAIRQLCSRSVWITDGRVSMDGPTETVLAAYHDEQFRESKLDEWIPLSEESRRGSGEAQIAEARVSVPGCPGVRTINPGQPLRVTVRVEATEDVTCGNIAFYLSTLGGLKLVSAGTGTNGEVIVLRRGLSEIAIDIDALHLNPGRYTGSLWLARPIGARQTFGLIDHLEDIVDVVVTLPLGDAVQEGVVATASTIEISPQTERP